MGIDLTGLRTLFTLKRLIGANFETIVTLGRHEVFFSEEEFDYVNKHGGLGLKYDSAFQPGSFQESLLDALGAGQIDSVDASSYENASIIHNFNRLIPSTLWNKYSLFIDFGSIEHIFEPKSVLKNISLLLKPGGYAAILTDSDGSSGHGLYQFSPEFFYSAFSKDNGFEETIVFLIDTARPKKWLLIKPPRICRQRVVVPEGRRYFILCIAKKLADVENIVVEQSDYADISWQTEAHKHSKQISTRGQIFRILRKADIFLYLNLRSYLHWWKKKKAFNNYARPFLPETEHVTPFELLSKF